MRKSYYPIKRSDEVRQVNSTIRTSKKAEYAYGGTTWGGLVKNSLVRHIRHGLSRISGFGKAGIALYSLDGQRLCQNAKPLILRCLHALILTIGAGFPPPNEFGVSNPKNLMNMAMANEDLFVEQWSHDSFGNGAFRERIRQRLILCRLSSETINLILDRIFKCGSYFSHYFSASPEDEERLSEFLRALEVMFVYNASIETLAKGKGLFESAFWALEKSDQILLWRYNLAFERSKTTVAEMQNILDKTMEINRNIAVIFEEFKVELTKIENTIKSERKLRYHNALVALNDNIEKRLDLGGLQR